MRYANPLQLDELAGGDFDLVAQIYLIYTLFQKSLHNLSRPNFMV